jgi:hypothetical protein
VDIIREAQLVVIVGLTNFGRVKEINLKKSVETNVTKVENVKSPSSQKVYSIISPTNCLQSWGKLSISGIDGVVLCIRFLLQLEYGNTRVCL